MGKSLQQGLETAGALLYLPSTLNAAACCAGFQPGSGTAHLLGGSSLLIYPDEDNASQAEPGAHLV